MADGKRERESFEAWVSASGRAHMLAPHPTFPGYKENLVQGWWSAWLARAERAEAAQPVAWLYPDGAMVLASDIAGGLGRVRGTEGAQPLYAAPVAEAAQRVPLTESEIARLYSNAPLSWSVPSLETFRRMFRLCEQAHGITATESQEPQP